MTTEVYLVGDKKAHETNNWLAMTNDQEKAVSLLREIPGAAQMKTINVEEKREAKRN